MKKYCFALATTILLFGSLLGCSNRGSKAKISFERENYDIYSGDKVTVKENYKGVTYSFAGDVPENVNLDASSGEVTFDKTVPHYSQVLYSAIYKGYSCSTVLTLKQIIETPSLEFTSPIKYVADGDYILASISDPTLSIQYGLKDYVSGVSIDSSTGRVTFNNGCHNGDKFIATISSNGAYQEKEFVVAKDNLAECENKAQYLEKNKGSATFILDFSHTSSSIPTDVLGIVKGNKVLDSSYYEYHQDSLKLIIKNAITNELVYGENDIGIITRRNIVKVNLIYATKLIRTAEDLASINDNPDTLQGYYILANDIDLTNYLKNNENGWVPIGTYHDVLDGTALADAFNGTLDGNGHTISGFFYNHTDLTGFNLGLFGYVNNLAVIKNLGLVGKSNYTSRGRSYIGALAGVNEGTISNCWTDVNVSNDTGDTVFKMCGGFVGNNLGLIKNCYSLGKVSGELQYGAFVGGDTGELVNCFANKESCPFYSDKSEDTGIGYFFNSFSEMKNFDYAASGFDKTYWNMEKGKLPTLNSVLKSYFVNGISVNVPTYEYARGTSIQLDIKLYPEELFEENKDNIVISTNDDGCVIDGFVVQTNENTRSDLVITAQIEIEGETLVDSVSLLLFDKATTINFNDDLPEYLEPGNRYRLNANVEPSSAMQDISWSLFDNKMVGVSLEDNILTVGENIVLNKSTVSSIKLVATALGLDSPLIIELNVKLPEYLAASTQSIYSDEDKAAISFALPGDKDLNGLKVYRGNKNIEFSLVDHIVSISRQEIEKTPDALTMFVFRLADGTYYRGYGIYYSHPHIVSSDIQNYIPINNASDFETYFNIKAIDENKYANYDKKYVLTGDIDFENSTIYSIGYSNDDIKHYFTGEIYGFDHEIRNTNITENESGSSFSVGLFSHFDGKIYDVKFSNINVNARNFCGVFAGFVEENGYLENLSFNNCSVKNIEEISYSKDDLRTGFITGVNHGLIVGCLYNGSTVNLWG